MHQFGGKSNKIDKILDYISRKIAIQTNKRVDLAFGLDRQKLNLEIKEIAVHLHIAWHRMSRIPIGFDCLTNDDSIDITLQ